MPTNQPCQRRKLRDISSPNLLSNVVVQVLRCEKAISAYATPRKKATATDSTVLTHVTLSDGAGSDDLMGLGGSANHGRVPSTLSSIPMTISLSVSVGVLVCGGGGDRNNKNSSKASSLEVEPDSDVSLLYEPDSDVFDILLSVLSLLVFIWDGMFHRLYARSGKVQTV